jgi:hypothetical protein
VNLAASEQVLAGDVDPRKVRQESLGIEGVL